MHTMLVLKFNLYNDWSFDYITLSIFLFRNNHWSVALISADWNLQYSNQDGKDKGVSKQQTGVRDGFLSFLKQNIEKPVTSGEVSMVSYFKL